MKTLEKQTDQRGGFASGDWLGITVKFTVKHKQQTK